jgi:hypothetical protein
MKVYVIVEPIGPELLYAYLEESNAIEKYESLKKEYGIGTRVLCNPFWLTDVEIEDKDFIFFNDGRPKLNNLMLLFCDNIEGI